MIAKLIAWCIENRSLVGLLTVTVAVIGVWAVYTIPVDAIPDLSDVQVIIYTPWQGRDPQTIEDQVTYPIASRKDPKITKIRPRSDQDQTTPRNHLPREQGTGRYRVESSCGSPGWRYIADTVIGGAGAEASSRGGDGFIGRRPKRRTVSTHEERSRPSRSRTGATFEGMRPRLPFTI